MMSISRVLITMTGATIMVLLIWGAYYGNRHKSMPLGIAMILVGLGACIFGFSLVFFVISKNDTGASLFAGFTLGVWNAIWFWVATKTKMFPG